jgi:putative ABC transport system permease protein
MVRTLIGCVVVLVWLVSLRLAASAQTSADGWRIPATAATEKNPFPANDAVLAAGKKVFSARCVRCHGPAGKGDGPDADQDHKEMMDLTRADRAAANPDGVVFYKVWNGRESPRMPVFADQLSKEQAWAVVAYAQTLRKKG